MFCLRVIVSHHEIWAEKIVQTFSKIQFSDAPYSSNRISYVVVSCIWRNPKIRSLRTGLSRPYRWKLTAGQCPTC